MLEYRYGLKIIVLYCKPDPRNVRDEDCGLIYLNGRRPERERERERLCHVGDSGHKWIALHCNKTPAMGYVWNFWFVLCIRLEEVEWFCKFPVSLIITT